MPHSVRSLPRQRPARAPRPSRVRLVQGMQPTEEKPCFFQRMTRQVLRLEHRARALLARERRERIEFQQPTIALDMRSSARRSPWKRLRPFIQPSKAPSASDSGRTLRIWQQLSVSCSHRSRCGIAALDQFDLRLQRAHIGQAEDVAQARRDNRASPRTASRYRETAPAATDRHRRRISAAPRIPCRRTRPPRAAAAAHDGSPPRSPPAAWRARAPCSASTALDARAFAVAVIRAKLARGLRLRDSGSGRPAPQCARLPVRSRLVKDAVAMQRLAAWHAHPPAFSPRRRQSRRGAGTETGRAARRRSRAIRRGSDSAPAGCAPGYRRGRP